MKHTFAIFAFLIGTCGASAVSAQSLDTSGRPVVISYVPDSSERVTVARWSDRVLAAPAKARRITTETYYRRPAPFNASRPTLKLVSSVTYDCETRRSSSSLEEHFDAAGVSMGVNRGPLGSYEINISRDTAARLACGLVQRPDLFAISEITLASDIALWRSLKDGPIGPNPTSRSDSLSADGSVHGPGPFTNYGLLDATDEMIAVVLLDPLARPSPEGYRPIQISRYLRSPGGDALHSQARSIVAMDADCSTGRTRINREEMWSSTAMQGTSKAHGAWEDNSASSMITRAAGLACQGGNVGLLAGSDAADFPKQFSDWLVQTRALLDQRKADAAARP